MPRNLKRIAHSALIGLLLSTSLVTGQKQLVAPEPETKYDAAANETTVRFPRIKLGGENGKYYSLHSVTFFKYPGRTKRRPELLTFELQTIVKARKLKVDLYVQLLIDGEKVFLSSNRWAEKNVVRGKPWVSEHIALRMPYEVFVKITKAKDFAIQMDEVKFVVADRELQMLRQFGEYLQQP